MRWCTHQKKKDDYVGARGIWKTKEEKEKDQGVKRREVQSPEREKGIQPTLLRKGET